MFQEPVELSCFPPAIWCYLQVVWKDDSSIDPVTATDKENERRVIAGGWTVGDADAQFNRGRKVT